MTGQSPPALPPLPPAAVVYGPGAEQRDALAAFAAALQERGWRVGGLVQETLYDAAGTKVGIDTVAVDTGARLALARPTPGQIADGTCALDPAALAESTAALRRAVDTGADLLVVEKFADQERKNAGLAEDILTALAEGVPTLVAVPAGALEDWQRFSGGLGMVLPMDPAALWRWWGPHRLYRDLLLGLGEARVARAAAGPGRVLVATETGCGLAPLADGVTVDADGLDGRPLADVAAGLESWAPGTAALGLAAVNAWYNRFERGDSPGPETPPFPLGQGRVRVGGAELPPLPAEADLTIGPEGLPPAAADWALPGREAVALGSRCLADRTLPRLLQAAGPAEVTLTGMATPLSERLFAYGLHRLAGLVVTDVEAAVRAVENGAADDALAACTRPVRLGN